MNDRVDHPLASSGLDLHPGAGGADIAGADGSVNCLDQTAAAVWPLADGKSDITAIVRAPTREFGMAEPPLADVERAIALLPGERLFQPADGWRKSKPG